MFKFSVLWLFILPKAALAHSGDITHSFEHGFLHPILGLDHLLVALAVGTLAVVLKKRSLLPIVFVCTAFLGALLGSLAIASLTEVAILFSLIGIGGMLSSNYKLPSFLCYFAVAAFGFFHGQAHGSEMLPTLSVATYFAGFISSTLLLHCLGIVLALKVRSSFSTKNEFFIHRMFGTSLILLGFLYIAN